MATVTRLADGDVAHIDNPDETFLESLAILKNKGLLACGLADKLLTLPPLDRSEQAFQEQVA